MNFHGRNRVLWIEANCCPIRALTEEFDHRDMSLIPTLTDEIPNQLDFAKAIVAIYNVECRKRIQRIITEYQPFDHGLLITVVCPDELYSTVYKEFAGLKRSAHGRLNIVSNAQPVHKIAQTIARHDPGPPVNGDVKVSGAAEPDVELLLRRAFFDGVSIRLVALSGGSDSKTFRADVVMKSVHNPEPLPYLVKCYSRIDKMEREKDNYRDFVENFIPFNHRPNLVHERCLAGQRFGLIVGDFVENSESLGEVAIRGVVHSAIHSLFQGALRGWRKQAFRYALDSSHSIYSSLTTGSKLDLYKEPTEEVRVQAEEIGVTSTFRDLDGAIQSFPAVKLLQGPIHRDLHVNNVHVHGTDAILLDFYATSPSGPLLYDAALLDVSVTFEAWKENKQANLDEWVQMVHQLYAETTLQFPLIPPLGMYTYPGITDAVQEIRLFAKGLELDKGSYVQALIIALLRIASPMTDIPPFRKAHAVCIAERLLKTKMGGEDNV